MSFKDVFSDRPLQGVDYDLHIGQVYRVADALTHWGRSWSYDVQLLAGQPEGTLTDSGSKGWELWTYALYRLGVPRAIAFNSFVLMLMLTGPAWVFLAGLGFGLSRWTCLLAGAMVSTLWFFDSHLHWVWFVGMISWTGASCIALFTLSVFYRFISQPSVPRAAVMSLCLGTCLLIHPYTFFVLALPMLALYVRAAPSLRPRDHLLIVGIALGAIAENAFWLINSLRHWHYILDSAFYAQARLLYLACDLFDVLCYGPDSGVIGTRTGFRFLYLGLAIAGLVLWRNRRDPRFLPFATSVSTLYGVAYLGEFIPGMQQTQPYRQITPAMLLSCLPAAAFLTSQTLRDLLHASSGPVRALLAILTFSVVQQLLATQVLYFTPELVPTPPMHPDGARSPLSGYGHISHPDLPDHVRYNVPHDPQVLEPGIEPCIQWLSQHTQPGERILVQASVLGERIAWRTHLEVLGGFFERNVMHVDANYFRKYQNYSATPEDLEHYLRTFAVRWIISNRPEFARAQALVQPETAVGVCRIYRTTFSANKVLAGGGWATASMNRILVRDSDPNQDVVVSYHWHEALRCKPDCTIERHRVPIDRVGFIRIPAPHPASIEIWNSYEL